MSEPRTDGVPLATRSRHCDVLAMGIVLLLMLLAAPAHHRVTFFDVRVDRVDGTGDRTRLPTPRMLTRPSGVGDQGATDALQELERRIRWTMRHDSAFASAPESSFEWTIRWSENSPRADRTRVLVLRGGPGAIR